MIWKSFLIKTPINVSFFIFFNKKNKNKKINYNLFKKKLKKIRHFNPYLLIYVGLCWFMWVYVDFMWVYV